MERICYVLEVRPGYEEEYRRRHREIWPELANEIRAAGLKNNAIWRYGLLLVGYFETENLEASAKLLQNSDVVRQWADYMAPILRMEIDPQTGFYFRLPCMWEQH